MRSLKKYAGDLLIKELYGLRVFQSSLYKVLTPFLLYSDRQGRIYSHPKLRMAVAHPSAFGLPKKGELIKMPKGSSLFYLPGRAPVGHDPSSRSFEILSQDRGKEVFAVSAFLIPAYLRLHIPAASLKAKRSLPLWAYTACGYYGGNFYVAAMKVDNRVRQSPRFYNAATVRKQVNREIARHPGNRLYKHLANCALNYNCLAAKNFFLKRWEAPLPTSKSCNARCLGCLSYQGSDCFAPSHQRIRFKPKIREVVEVMAGHLTEAREPIVSFGQGCEGEPILAEELISSSIKEVRKKVSRGTININTNASVPKSIKRLCEAGIDSFRVSLNSAQGPLYNRYFNPCGYKFRDVLKSIETAKKYGKFVALNLLVFPGASDSEKEIKALVKLIRNTGIDMVQWRNLNIDSDYYLRSLPYRSLNPEGIVCLVETIEREFPDLKTGYFNLPKEKFTPLESSANTGQNIQNSPC